MPTGPGGPCRWRGHPSTAAARRRRPRGRARRPSRCELEPERRWARRGPNGCGPSWRVRASVAGAGDERRDRPVRDGVEEERARGPAAGGRAPVSRTSLLVTPEVEAAAVRCPIGLGDLADEGDDVVVGRPFSSSAIRSRDVDARRAAAMAASASAGTTACAHDQGVGRPRAPRGACARSGPGSVHRSRPWRGACSAGSCWAAPCRDRAVRPDVVAAAGGPAQRDARRAALLRGLDAPRLGDRPPARRRRGRARPFVPWAHRPCRATVPARRDERAGRSRSPSTPLMGPPRSGRPW